jgi:hypothetical protein
MNTPMPTLRPSTFPYRAPEYPVVDDHLDLALKLTILEKWLQYERALDIADDDRMSVDEVARALQLIEQGPLFGGQVLEGRQP